MNETNQQQPKQLCDRCGFMVRMEGHAERCRVQAADALPKGVWSDQRIAAWIGDRVHRLDVQLALMYIGTRGVSISGLTDSYVSNEAQAVYLRARENGWHDRSVHACGTAFEAQYEGDFRVEYLRSKFPDVFVRVLAAWQPPMLREDARRVFE